MDVETGAILAMSTKNDFDPNNPSEIKDEKILEEISSKANSRYIDDGEVISFWCESTKQNVYIRDPRRWKYKFEKSLFNLNATYTSIF